MREHDEFARRGHGPHAGGHERHGMHGPHEQRHERRHRHSGVYIGGVGGEDLPRAFKALLDKAKAEGFDPAEAFEEARRLFGGGPAGRNDRGSGRGPRGPRGGGRGRGPSYGHESAPPTTEGLAGYLAGRLPADWFTGAPEVSTDRDEVLIVGTLPNAAFEGDDRAEFDTGRIRRFREETRDERVAIAREIEQRYSRSVAWGAVAGDTREVFTNLSVPVMTRLRQPERQVLDTLVDGGVARSRSDALAWCVRLVGKHSDSWLAEIRDALQAVEKLRSEGPDQS